MKEDLLIIGASGHGKVVADIALKMNKWKSISFLDDNENLESSMGLEVKGPSNQVLTYIEKYDIFVGVGDNYTRQKLHNNLERCGASIPILIHPNAIIGSHVIVESGTVIMAGVIINCCTKVGKGCIINTGATIDHDNRIEDFVHISPGAHLAGTVKVGARTWLGVGSVISNNINIIENCKIGAGAVVVNNLNDSGVYIGVPAKKDY